MSDHTVFLGMPGFGDVSAAAAMAFWRSSKLPRDQVIEAYKEGSLLAANFNRLWVDALNLQRIGRRVDYFAMQHADIEPTVGWLDVLIEELEANSLDVLGVVSPIKDLRGLSSIALARPDEDPWRPACRLTMGQVLDLPPTFTREHVGHNLLINTGLWVCRFDPGWNRKVCFTVNDRLILTLSGEYFAEVEPEDWNFSRQCHRLGLKLGVTRKVALNHRGPMPFPNHLPWGEPYDSAYVEQDVLPPVVADRGFRFPRDIDGWLTYDEGEALNRLAAGREVLEIGSYCGRSTVCMAQSAEHVTAVDWWDGRGTPDPRSTLEAFRSNARRYGVSHKVLPLRADAPLDALAPCQFAFIDGAHDYESVKADIVRAASVLSHDGLIAFHDYRPRPGSYDGRWDPGVTQAVDELLSAGGNLVSLTGTVAVIQPPVSFLATSET